MHYYGLYRSENTVSFLVSGCRYKDCVVSEALDFYSGEEITEPVIQRLIKLLPKNADCWLYIQGGDIFEPENIDCAFNVIQRVRKARPLSKIAVWSGHSYELLSSSSYYRDVLEQIDCLVGVVSGVCVPDMIDVQASLQLGKVVRYNRI